MVSFEEMGKDDVWEWTGWGASAGFARLFVDLAMDT